MQKCCHCQFFWCIISQHRFRFNDSDSYRYVEEDITLFERLVDCKLAQELPTKKRRQSLVGRWYVSIPWTGCCLSCLICLPDQANRTTINPYRDMSVWIHSHSCSLQCNCGHTVQCCILSSVIIGSGSMIVMRIDMLKMIIFFKLPLICELQICTTSSVEGAIPIDDTLLVCLFTIDWLLIANLHKCFPPRSVINYW